jgi:hypothetical protein
MCATGIAIASFDDLIGDDRLWRELVSEMDAFVREARGRTSVDLDQPMRKDDYLIRRFGGAVAAQGGLATRLSGTDPWLRLGVSDAILNVVNAYRDQWTRLVDLDAWYTVPFATARKRVASQRWHRDPEDLHVVKVFVYFSDVDDDAGPFQYVPGSASGARRPPRGPLGSLRLPWNRWRLYPPRGQLERRMADSEVLTATGPAGTMILCDTSGLHRGGLATRTPRTLTYHTYVGSGAVAKRTFTVEGTPEAGLSAVARFALE